MKNSIEAACPDRDAYCIIGSLPETMVMRYTLNKSALGRRFRKHRMRIKIEDTIMLKPWWFIILTGLFLFTAFGREKWKPVHIESRGSMVTVSAEFLPPIKNVSVQVGNLRKCFNLLLYKGRCNCQIYTGTDSFFADSTLQDTSDLIIVKPIPGRRYYEIMTVIELKAAADTLVPVTFWIDGTEYRYEHFLSSTSVDKAFNEKIKEADEFMSIMDSVSHRPKEHR
jgi:hypothetical protein